jgi:hypothetical protein
VVLDAAEEETGAQKLTTSRLDGKLSHPEPVIETTTPTPISEAPQKLAGSRLAGKTAKPEKRAVAIRLTADALRRLMEIETSLRGSGFSAHQASASEIMMTLLEAADIGDLRERLSRRFGKAR